MAYSVPEKKVTAIVAAYNEGKRLSAVLEVICASPLFHEVIVVDDGSTDNTAVVAQSFPVRFIRLVENQGKGTAMDTAVQAAQGNIIFFSDADVRGLREDVLETIVLPVAQEKTEMVIGMRNRKIYYLRFVFAFIPLLGGERAVTRELWNKIPTFYKHRFMIEAALNFYARHYGKGFQYKVFEGLSQTIKEKKQGLLLGFMNRIKMFYEVIYAEIRLQLFDTPRTIRSGRLALTNMFGGIIGFLFGVFLLFLSYINPLLRVQIFLGNTPVPFFSLLRNVSQDLLWISGTVIIALNMLLLLIGARNIRFLLYKPASVDRIP